jgi:hypothetical protein
VGHGHVSYLTRMELAPHQLLGTPVCKIVYCVRCSTCPLPRPHRTRTRARGLPPERRPVVGDIYRFVTEHVDRWHLLMLMSKGMSTRRIIRILGREDMDARCLHIRLDHAADLPVHLWLHRLSRSEMDISIPSSNPERRQVPDSI